MFQKQEVAQTKGRQTWRKILANLCQWKNRRCILRITKVPKKRWSFNHWNNTMMVFIFSLDFYQIPRVRGNSLPWKKHIWENIQRPSEPHQKLHHRPSSSISEVRCASHPFLDKTYNWNCIPIPQRKHTTLQKNFQKQTQTQYLLSLELTYWTFMFYLG